MPPWVGNVLRRFRWKPFGLYGFTNVVVINNGGFSTVYRADQPQFNRTVAIKVLDPRHLNKQHLRSRFDRECKAQGMLGGHPHVVSVFDAGITRSGEPYIVMEHLPAGSLADRLDAEGALPWGEGLAIGVKLAGALQSAHEAGVRHRDVKPGNVLVGQDGEPKLADFGIAILRAEPSVTTETPTLTVGYAAPELFDRNEPTDASDLYGLGAALFTLLAGHPPFLRSCDEELNVEVWIGRMLFEPVPDLRPRGIPDRLCAVVERAMAKRAADRFESAAELGEALQAVQHEHGLPVSPLLVVPITELPRAQERSPARTRRLAIVLLIVVTLVTGGVGVVAWHDTCGQAKTVQADSALSFGTLLPKTGSFIYTGPALQASVRLAVKDINEAGGIPGISVQLDEANQLDEGDGASAPQSTHELLSNGVDVIIGAGTSAVSLKVIDEVVCAGVILFSPSNSSPAFSTYKDHGFYFRTAPSDVLRGPELAKLLAADGNTTAVVIGRDDRFGNDLRQLTQKAIEDSGGRVLDSFSYDQDALNYDREVQRIKDNNPDAIFLVGLNDTAPILTAMIEQGLGPQDKKVYGAGYTSNSLPRLVNPRDPGVLAGMKGIVVDDGGDAFSSRLKEINPGLQDFSLGAEAYDAVVVTALAAAVAGTDAPAAIAERINGVTKQGEKCMSYAACMTLVGEGTDIDYDGVSGPLEFADPGEPTVVTYVVVEFQADGSLKPLKTITSGSRT